VPFSQIQFAVQFLHSALRLLIHNKFSFTYGLNDPSMSACVTDHSSKIGEIRHDRSLHDLRQQVWFSCKLFDDKAYL